MERLKAKTEPIVLTIEKYNYINELIDRDNEKAIIGVRETHTDADGNIIEYMPNTCPVCGTEVGNDFNFCKKCGQRLDTKNYAF